MPYREERGMSQANVERIIGRLITDEEFRRRFAEDPQAALSEITDRGVELTCLELKALASIDPQLTESLAEAIDSRIQKACLHARNDSKERLQ
jgi:putative modified peptide